MLRRSLFRLAVPEGTAAVAKTKVTEFKTPAELQIGRYDPHGKGFWIDTYMFDLKQPYMVMDLLMAVKVHFDPALSFRNSCCEGICGSCAMNINGINTLACITEAQARTVVLPLPNIPILKDLVNDFRYFFKQYELIRPYSGNKNKDRYHIQNIAERYLQKVEEQKTVTNYGPCIEELIDVSNAPTFQKLTPGSGNSTFETLVKVPTEKSVSLTSLDDERTRGLAALSDAFRAENPPPAKILPTRNIQVQEHFNSLYEHTFVREQAVGMELAYNV